MNEFASLSFDGATLNDDSSSPDQSSLQMGDLVTLTIVDVFETDNQGKLLSFCPTFDNKKIRGHAFQFKLMFPKKIKNWDRRVEYLEKNKIPYSLVGNKKKIIKITLNYCIFFDIVCNTFISFRFKQLH
jgi:hypothetical protein